MISQSHPKIVKGLILICIFIVIIMPDMIIQTLIELFHILFEFLIEVAHVLFEWIESALDTVIEHMFETDLHETQVIVFYIMLFAGFYGLYRLLCLLPPAYQRLKAKLQAGWELKKIRTILYWRDLSMTDKIKWIAICIAVITSYIFFGF
ncbi:MAG: hypothetical protein ACXW1W_02305 [Methylococcaceae bacterium]